MKPVKRNFNGLFPTFDNLWNDFFSDDFSQIGRAHV